MQLVISLGFFLNKGELQFLTKSAESTSGWLSFELNLDKPYTLYNYAVSVEKVDYRGQMSSSGMIWNECSYREDDGRGFVILTK